MQPKKLIFTHCTRHQYQWKHLLVALFLVAGGLLALTTPARAADITVNGTTCRLVDAISAANMDTATNGCPAGSGADTITLESDVTLTQVYNAYGNEGPAGLPMIQSVITIEGGNHTISRAAGAPVFRFFIVWFDGTLTLNRVTLHNGQENGFQGGGAILSRGTVTINSSTLSGNSSPWGGAIMDKGTALTVNNSTFAGNAATNGGAISHPLGTLTVNNSTFAGNAASATGGAIESNATLTLVRSLFSGNTAPNGAEIYRVGGTLNANNYNLFGDSSKTNAQALFSFTPGATDRTATSNGTNPTALAGILNPTLQVNGSGAPTHALVPGSPAIDAAGDSGFVTDQRGITRPQGAADDIGAFELVSGPTLKVESNGISLVNGDQLNVPVVFTGNGAAIASVGFALDYQESCLAFDATDSDGNGVPDAITGLPAAFAPSISHQPSKSSGELEIALYDDSSPISTLSDGTLFTVQFTVQAACLPSTGAPTSVAINFSTTPAVSFGDPTGADVTGTASGATITLQYTNSAPTALSLGNSSVAENSLANTTVGTFSTTDANTGDSFTYSLVSGTGSTDNASFTISGNTLKTAAIFDYETKSSYAIRVRTTDSGGLFFEQSFTISVTDVAEAPTAVDDVVDPRVTVFLGGQADTINVLANDLANGGGTLSIATITQPANSGGSVTNNNTNVSYTAPNANGSASFTYQATNGSATSNSATVSVNYVANHARGDCNGNGGVSAADFIGIVLEIFDANNTKYQNQPAWWFSYTGDFAGSPLGCDANNSRNGADNSSASVTAADIICSVLIFFGHPCGGAVQAAGATATTHLAVADQQATVGATTTLTVTLDTGGNAIVAATFALALDPAVLHFATADADADGVPDAITLNTPTGMSKSATWNAAAKRLEVAVFGMSLPLPTLTDGTLATVAIIVNQETTVNTTPLALDLVSFSDPDGHDLPFTDQDGTLTIETSPGQRTLFLPLAVRE